MLMKIWNFLKCLLSKFFTKPKSNESKEQEKTVEFSIVLPKLLFNSLSKLDELTITRSKSSNMQQIAKRFIDFKTVRLKCYLSSNSSSTYLFAVLKNIKKENGKYQLTISLEK